MTGSILTQSGELRQSPVDALASFRLLCCRWCRCTVVVCRRCELRQRYCPGRACAALSRVSGCRRYRGDHGRTRAGRRAHAAAQARWRLRRELLVLEAALATVTPSSDEPSFPIESPARPTSGRSAVAGALPQPGHVGSSSAVSYVEGTTSDGSPSVEARTYVVHVVHNAVTDNRTGSTVAVDTCRIDGVSDCAEPGIQTATGQVGTQEVMDHTSTTAAQSLDKGASKTESEESIHETTQKKAAAGAIRLCGVCGRPCGPFIHFIDDW